RRPTRLLSRRGVEPERLAHHRDRALGAERLAEHEVDTVLAEPLGIEEVPPARDEDDAGPRARALDGARDGEARPLGQRQIGENDREAVALYLRRARGPVG